MNVKLFEVRDHATFIPAIAIEIHPQRTCENDRERWLMRKAGYSYEYPMYLLGRLDGTGKLTFDPYEWSNRTMRGAHLYIMQHWNDLKSGDVVDARVALGEATEAAISDMVLGE